MLHRTLNRLTVTHILNYNEKMTIQYSSVIKLLCHIYIYVWQTIDNIHPIGLTIIRQYLQNWTQLELTGGALKHKETTHYSYEQQSCTRKLLTFCSIPNLCKICGAAEWCRNCWMSYYVVGRKVPDVSKKSSNPRKILGVLDLCSWRHPFKPMSATHPMTLSPPRRPESFF